MRRILDFETKTSIENQNELKDVLINTYPINYNPKFSIVLPVHNEEKSITKVVLDIYNKLGKNPDFPFEIILAEDGSNDNTKRAILDLSENIPLKAILSHARRGYSGGIKEGLKLVTSRNVIISDSDGQHRPEDFWKLKKKLDGINHPENVIVSGNRTRRADSLQRRIISKTFQKLSAILFDLPPMKDITSPFKLMHSSLAKKIASECKFMKESFWTEFIIRANYRKIRIVEVDVQHVDRLEGETVVYSKSKIPKIIINQLIALLDLKRELTGVSSIRSILKTRFFRRLISFALVGASGAGIILFVMWSLISVFNMNYILGGAIAIQLSIIWAFFLNDRITFRDKIPSEKKQVPWLRRLLKYNMTALSGELINLSLLFALTSAGFFYLVSEVIAILIVFAYNFTISNNWVWKDNRSYI